MRRPFGWRDPVLWAGAFGLAVIATCLAALVVLCSSGCGGAWTDAGCTFESGPVRWRCTCAERRFVLLPHPDGRPKPAARIVHRCDGRDLPLVEDVDDVEVPR